MKRPRRTLVELGHFAPPSPLIMVSLAGGPKHGYAIMQDIAELTGVRLGAGTLYGALARLERLELVESLPSPDRRQPYRLTRTGLIALRWHLAGVAEVASAGLKRLQRRLIQE